MKKRPIAVGTQCRAFEKPGHHPGPQVSAGSSWPWVLTGLVLHADPSQTFMVPQQGPMLRAQGKTGEKPEIQGPEELRSGPGSEQKLNRSTL